MHYVGALLSHAFLLSIVESFLLNWSITWRTFSRFLEPVGISLALWHKKTFLCYRCTVRFSSQTHKGWIKITPNASVLLLVAEKSPALTKHSSSSELWSWQWHKCGPFELQKLGSQQGVLCSEGFGSVLLPVEALVMLPWHFTGWAALPTTIDIFPGIKCVYICGCFESTVKPFYLIKLTSILLSET